MDKQRLARQVASAMADGTDIGWEALLENARTPAERAAIQRLRGLDVLRRPPADEDQPSLGPVTDAIILLIAAVAGAQVLVALATFLFDLLLNIPARWPLPQLAITLAFTVAAGILSRARHDRRSLPLLAAYLTAAAAFCRPFAGSGRAVGAAAPLYVGVIVDAFTPACLWYFAVQFPRVTRFTRVDAFARMAARISLCVGAVLLVANLGIRHGLALAAPFTFLARRPGLYWAIFTLLAAPALGTVFWRSARASPMERRRVRGFGLALGAGLAPFFAWEALTVVAPEVQRRALGSPVPPWRSALDVVVLTGFLLTPILTTFAMLRDGALDLKGWARRATQYGLAQATLSAGVLAPSAALVSLIYLNRDRTVEELLSGPLTTTLLLCAITALGALAARNRLVDAIDRLFFRANVDHRRRLSTALERVRGARSRREVATILADEGSAGPGCERLVIFSAQPGQGFVPDIGSAPLLPVDSAVASLVRSGDAVIDLSTDSSARALLPRPDRQWLRRANLQFFVPIAARDETVDVVLAFGSKRDRLPMNDDERWLMRSLATAVAPIWSRVDAPPAMAWGCPIEPDESAVECVRCGVVAARRPLPCDCNEDVRVAALPVHLRGKFQVLRRIGAGTMGVVYLAHDRDLGRQVALKTLPAVTGAAVNRLRREARAMASVNHEAMAMIYGLEMWRDTPVLVVERLSGGTLADRLARGPLPVPDALQLAIRLAGGLAALHDAGLLHRDVKPSNIGLTETGAAKLLDFGVAGLADALGETAGTPLYWPPEAFDGATATVAFDLWALNVVLCETVTGTHPFAAPSFEELRVRVRSPRLGGMPALLQPYVDDALSPSAAQRPANAARVQELLGLVHLYEQHQRQRQSEAAG